MQFIHEIILARYFQEQISLGHFLPQLNRVFI